MMGVAAEWGRNPLVQLLLDGQNGLSGGEPGAMRTCLQLNPANPT